MIASAYVPLEDQQRKKYEPIDDHLSENWKKRYPLDGWCNKQCQRCGWVGWNANLLPRNNNKQVVEYVKQINQSPTSHSVMLETLKRSKKLATESGKKVNSCHVQPCNCKNYHANSSRRVNRIWQYVCCPGIIPYWIGVFQWVWQNSKLIWCTAFLGWIGNPEAWITEWVYQGKESQSL